MPKSIYERFSELHKVQNRMNDWLHFEIMDCDEEKGEYFFRCIADEWMCNPMGTLHGGISATILDHAMGSVAFCMVADYGIAPAVQLQVQYHRPMAAGKNILVHIKTISVTKSLIHFYAEAYHEELPEKVCISGNGTYFIKLLSYEK